MRVVLCASPLKPQFHHLIQTPSSPPKLPAASPPQSRRVEAARARAPPPFSVIKSRRKRKPGTPGYLLRSRRAVLGAGMALLIIMGTGGMDGQEARALEGPLAEEFWENVRRYGLYILTVSTGAIYTIFQPIVELLKNPITAILILTVLAGGFYLVSQVVSAMIGLTNFTYDYGY